MTDTSTAVPVTHLIGVSIPRSGHHYLVRLMEKTLGNKLRYCPFYSPADCCHSIPCTRHGNARIIFQKNHDLDLRLDARLPHCLYLVQTRDPLNEALSDRELLETVHPELKGDLDELVVWLGWKAAYYRHFFRKWVAAKLPHSIHIPYEELVRNPEGVIRSILQRIGFSADPDAIAAAVSQHAGIREHESSEAFVLRKSRVDDGRQVYFDIFRSIVAGCGGSFKAGDDQPSRPHDPRIELAILQASAAQGAMLMSEYAAAIEAWDRFCRQFPDNVHGQLALAQCKRATGDLRGALHIALKAARQAPACFAALKLARDLLAAAERPRAAQPLSGALLRNFPNRPSAIIDHAVDLYHGGRQKEAGALVQQFLAIAGSFPLDFNTSHQVWYLRCIAYGYNESLFWEVACNILLASDAVVDALAAANFAYALSGNDAALLPLVKRAKQAADDAAMERPGHPQPVYTG